MFKVSYIDKKETPRKKNISLKNISVEHLRLVDIDTGEDISEAVLAEIPQGISACDFKLCFEVGEDE